MLIMKTKFQDKIDRNDFVVRNFNLLIESVTAELEECEKCYKRSLKKTVLIFLFSIVTLLLVCLWHKGVSFYDILLWIGFFTFIFAMGFIMDVIDFQNYHRRANKCEEILVRFKSYNWIKSDELMDVFESDDFIENESYWKIKQKFLDLKVYESICNNTLIDYQLNDSKKKVKAFKYCDEDGVVERIETNAKVKESITLEEGNYLVQMTENGLIFVKPKK